MLHHRKERKKVQAALIRSRSQLDLMVLAFPELKPRKVAKPELTSDGQEKEEVVVATGGDFKMEGTILCIDVYFLRMTVD